MKLLLLLIIEAKDGARLLFGSSERRQKQAGQNRDNGDYHKQLNQSEGTLEYPFHLSAVA